MSPPSFESVDGGMAIADPIDRHRYVLSTPEPVDPAPADADAFRAPVDAAVSVRTRSFSLPSVVAIHVRNSAGVTVRTAEHFADERLPAGTYTIEVSAPLKLYLRVESAVHLTADAERMAIDFGERTEVVVGARSHHSQPAATVTTPTDPESMMAAVSTFGSALKTTSPERSYPTLRGHPPTIELGEELDLAGLEPPDTGVTIEIPRDLQHVFVVAPLAYYLGARVVPGESPTLRTNAGLEYPLDGPHGFETTVERTLKRTFFLDCLTRTEGLYPVNLHERSALESRVDLDFAALYDRPLADRLEASLDVPFDILEPHLPQWKLTTHVEPTPDSLETIPFLLDDLAVVRCDDTAKALNAPKTIRTDGGTRATPGGESTRAFVRPEPDASLERAWVGEGTPLGASKAMVEAYRNRLDRTPTEGDITVRVVCNDPEMDEERDLVDDIYGERDLPFDVAVERDLTTRALRGRLSERTDFLHYVGHVDDRGFECVDGTLDAATLDSVGVDAFLLNACRSYDQGMSLIEAGSIGGIVTLSDVLNAEAVTMGKTLAGLLNAGFPLHAALEIARGESIVGEEYLVVGDGGFALAQSPSGNPNLLAIERYGETFELEVRYYLTSQWGIGTLITPHIVSDEYYISSSNTIRFDLSKDELERFLTLENAPVEVNGELSWSTQVDLDRV